MSEQQKPKPRVLCFSGLDPTGGAGIQADIESMAAHHCHCLPVITLNTVQDSQGVYEIQKTADGFIEKQVNHLAQDGPIAAIKIGLLADEAQIKLLASLIKEMPNIPVVIDTIFASGLGDELAKEKHIQAMVEHLLPLASIITPNSIEAFQLLGKDTNTQSIEDCGTRLLKSGANAVLITGTHESEKAKTENVLHRLFIQNGIQTYSSPRLKGNYHGSGCTLASSICALLAQSVDLENAIERALAFTEQTLLSAQALGKHQLFPNRSPNHSAA